MTDKLAIHIIDNYHVDSALGSLQKTRKIIAGISIRTNNLHILYSTKWAFHTMSILQQLEEIFNRYRWIWIVTQ